MAEEARLIGARARERRDELGLSQGEVARRMPGSTQGADVSRWERGKHRPQPDALDHLAAALETTVADLIAGPLSERPEKGPTPDPFASLSLDEVEEQEADDAMREAMRRILAGQARLLAELGKVQQQLQALRGAQQPPGQRSAGSDS
jgi:transcriptional regulator with XRE-family HTH domain